ncbi:SPASM domain-containing protein [bacterium]|nr:SPASM domain-containing protein [candidate division CSSED10-310 bacterium]
MNELHTSRRLAAIAAAYWRRSETLRYLPLRMWVEPTNKCNLRCTVCPNSTDRTSPRGLMPIAMFNRIAADCAGHTYDMNLSHRGESLFHPELTGMIHACRHHGIRSRLHTNATILTTIRSRELILAGLNLMSFSFDGFDKQTYEDIRRGACFEETLSNILGFLREKRRLQKRRPYTVFQVIDIGQNGGGDTARKAFLARFEGLPLDKLYVKQPHNWAGNMADYGGAETVTPISPCTFPWYSLTVLWDGTVVPCPQDWYGVQPLGNLHRQSLWEIWNGAPMRTLRHRMKNFDLEGIEPCCRCDRVARATILGVPVENMRAFLGETMLGYDLVRKIIRR